MESINDISASILGPWVNDKSPVVKLALSITLMIVLVRVLKELLEHLTSFIKWLIGAFKPMDYELDMTDKEYCKYLAEVDNNLQFQRKRERVTLADNRQSHESLDCATGLLDNASAGPEGKSGNERGSIGQANSAANNDTQVGSSDHLYPNGWLPVMESTKVRPGEIKRAIIMGRDIIVTRSKEGIASVLDAYCPHMGANIGVGGRVLDLDNQSCVQCPFHGWTFRASDGQCVGIPYLKKEPKCGIPNQAKLRTWLCSEIDNFIYIWHHIDNQPPSWYLQPTAELATGQYVLAGRSCHKTNLELRDMLENGADMNHFEGIHNDLFVFGGKFLKVQAYNYVQKYSRHHWAPDWKPILNEEGKTTHMAEMYLNSWITLFRQRLFDIEVRATQIGPACVSLRYTSKWYGSGILKMNSIPLGGRKTLYVQHIYTERSYFHWFMAKWVLFGEIMQLERDFFIWNHKKNIGSPIFIPEDKITKRFRLWYSQFYKRKCKIVISDSDHKKDQVAKCIDNKLIEQLLD